MLNLVFVEAALETVPESIRNHPAVMKNAERSGKKPVEVLLDRSLHHAAMKSLPKAEKRGRPDILHFCLLEALGSPLNMEGGLRIWVNTFGGYTISVSPKVRLPRDCNRFKGLMEQLFKFRRVPPESSEPLLTVEEMGLQELIKAMRPDKVIALSSHGKRVNLVDLCNSLKRVENPAAFIGAYPTGPFEEGTLSLVDEVFSIYPLSLEAWVVTSRLIYQFERKN
ncbi:16S rRNA methyltransferase [Candidatus Bathyarchaeota archaeon]|nr:16S rRNA methyltransferase [Candidatus Bathyarchaeota archaeon]